MRARYARGLSPYDVSNAIGAQNLILPNGTAKIGPIEYNVNLDSSPTTVDALDDLPIKQAGGQVICIRDVAQVRDGAKADSTCPAAAAAEWRFRTPPRRRTSPQVRSP